MNRYCNDMAGYVANSFASKKVNYKEKNNNIEVLISRLLKKCDMKGLVADELSSHIKEMKLKVEHRWLVNIR